MPERWTKLYVSNLGDGVSNNDISVLFSYIGSLSSSTLKYDRMGRPTGIAEVVFNDHFDVMRALRKYHNLPLDGRPMKIKVADG
nr:THO complex subunit 4A [Ipomoea batatas]